MTFYQVNNDPRPDRLTYGKALPFGKVSGLNNLLRIAWNAELSRLRGGGREGTGFARKARFFAQVRAAEPREAIA